MLEIRTGVDPMSRTATVEPAPWVRRAGIAAIASALPTILWRVVVGAGAPLGTPASWRHTESLPGSGTWYVVGLSVVQLLAALATLALFVPGADRVPRFSPVLAGRRLPARAVTGAALAGSLALAVIVALSIAHWHAVDPFANAPGMPAARILCLACYAAAIAWPPLLAAAAVGYRVTARRA